MIIIFVTLNRIFNRFIIKCDKDNMNCIKGSYDWCTGEWYI